MTDIEVQAKLRGIERGLGQLVALLDDASKTKDLSQIGLAIASVNTITGQLRELVTAMEPKADAPALAAPPAPQPQPTPQVQTPAPATSVEPPPPEGQAAA